MRGFLQCIIVAVATLLVACSLFSTTIDPFHPPKKGEPAPAVVVEIELPNRYEFDLIPVRVNGVAMVFNDDPWDNGEEPLRIPPGLVRFVFANTGTISHNLRVRTANIEPPPIDVIAPPPPNHLMAGQMGEMEVVLPEGEYEMSCAITMHFKRGMLRPLIVTSEVSYPPPPLKIP